MLRRLKYCQYFLILLLITVLNSVNLKAQAGITLYLVDKGWSGDTNIIELRAVQFQHVTSMQFSLKESNDLGRLVELDQWGIPNFSGANYFFSNNSLRVAWDNSFINGMTLPDGGLLFRLKWLSDPSKKHCYNIVSTPAPIEFISYTAAQIPYRLFGSCDSFSTIPAYFNVFRDLAMNCVYDNQEPLFTDYTIVDEFNGTSWIYRNPQLLFYSQTEYGTHTYTVIPDNPLWHSCTSPKTMQVDNNTRFIQFDYGIQPLINCARLEVDINTPIVRRCIDYSYKVRYVNTGTIPQSDTKIRITLDSFMIFKSASIPVAAFQFPYLDFDIGFLDVFKAGEFDLTVQIDCNKTIVGQTHCIKAVILPEKDCIINPSWSGASLELSARCEQGQAKFRIKNGGQNNMTEPSQYWIVEDDIMPGLKKDVQLDAGSFFDLEYNALGKTYRLLVDQVDFHPGESNPTIALEGCGRNQMGEFSTGYFLQFAEDEEDPCVAVDCQESRGSFDPNDKSGFPFGYGKEHFIEADRNLEYKIRFQNIGTDTAFKVIITDTLSEWADLKSFEITGASHPYSYQLINHRLVVQFDEIELPYAAINEEKSHGYFSYKLKALTDIPLGTRIENTAHIYFDFNPAITTNTTFHTIGKDFIVISTEDTGSPASQSLHLYPNPGNGNIKMEFYNLADEKVISLFDSKGMLIYSKLIHSDRLQFEPTTKLNPGLYIIKVVDRKGRNASAKLMIN